MNVAAVVSPRHIRFDERATLELTISGKTLMKHIGAPTFNFLPSFLAVPLHTKTTPRLVDDKVAVTMAWAYELIPKQVGEIALSDVQFSYQGVPYFANPGTIIVGALDTYVNPPTGGIHKVLADVSNRKPYLNEGIEYRFRYLYTVVLPTADSPAPVLPELPDFLAEELPTETDTTVQIEGKTYQVQEVTRRLYPQKTGKIVIQSANLILPLKGAPKTLKTATVTLTVLPLPEIGRPPNFTGTVGEYNISAHIDRNRTEVGKALSLSLKIEGKGNMQTVTAPKLPTIAGVRIGTQPRVEKPTAGSRVYTYALIPSQEGTLWIPAIEYVYFNPHRKAYQTTQTTRIPINVLPNPNAAGDSETDTALWKWGILLFLLVLLLAGLAGGGYVWYRAQSTPKTETVEPDAPPNVREQTLSALKNLANSKTGGGAKTFGEALAQTLYQYLNETLGLSQRTSAEVQKVGAQAGISKPILQEVEDILTQCDYLRFAPAPLTTEERNALISRAEAVIYHVDKAL